MKISMEVDSRGYLSSTNINIDRAKFGLLYDADCVSLIGKFTDELAAFRARKNWVLILNNYFLLEPERDFELQTICSLEDGRYVLICSFMSACGRYAFWRLINQQAPEAEQKLGGFSESHKGPKASRPTAKSKQESQKTEFVLNALEEQMRNHEQNKSLVNRLLQLFK